MGKILSSRRGENGIIFELEVEPIEATILQGHYDDIHVFSERVAEFKTNISSRGKNDVTKYFLIPRHLRKNINLHSFVNCQKIETPSRIIFIYVVNRYGN